MNQFDIGFDPLLPVPVLALLGLVGLLLLGLALYLRQRGSLLRSLAFLLLFLALLDPSIRQEERQPLSDIAVAVIDRSQSQQAGTRMQQTADAEEALKQAAAKLGNTELRIVEVRSGITAEDDGTRAFEALNRVLAEVPPERFAGAIMVTDGEIHDVPADPSKSGINGPIHGLIAGSPDERDRKMVIDQAPRFGIVGKEQTIAFHVDEVNGTGEPVSVSITIGREEPVTLMVTPGVRTELPIMINHGGQNIVEITAAPMENEISTSNNRAVAVVEGVRDRLRVLLISGEPHAGERTWRNLLKADASVDLVHFTILRPPEKQDGTPIKELALIAFPTRELFVEKLDQFDLVIFDRYRRQAVLPLSYLSNVADYVSKGGAVLISSGPDFASEDGLYNTPLADVIPAAPTGQMVEGGFKPKVTDAGEKHPVTKGLAGDVGGEPKWGRWFRLVDTEPQRGEIVMSGKDDRPLLVLSREGEGRVAQMLSDQGWLWSRGFEGGGPQTELLRRIAHWLMKEPDLEEEALTARQQGDSLVVERRTMEDKAEPVTVTLPSGKTEKVELAQVSPGRFQGSAAVTEAGLHRLSDGKLEAVAAAGSADAKEARDLVATDRILRPVAQATGGSVNWLSKGMPQLVKVGEGRQMAGSGWIGLKDNGADRVMSVSELPLFASLLSLAALLFAVSAMWYREGR